MSSIPGPKASHVPAPARKPRALFIGFEASIGNGITRLSAHEGFDATAVRSNEEGLVLLRSAKTNGNPFDLVAFEPVMPSLKSDAASYDALRAERSDVVVKSFREKRGARGVDAGLIAKELRETQGDDIRTLDTQMRIYLNWEAGTELLKDCKAEGLLDATTHVHCLDTFSFLSAEAGGKPLDEAGRALGKQWQGRTEVADFSTLLETRILPELKSAIRQR